MTSDAINQYDNVAANNLEVGGVDTSSSMAPSDVNDAIRELMSHLADVNDGTSSLTSPDINGGSIDGTVIGGSSAAAGTFTTLGVSGKGTFSGAGSFEALELITSDANRVYVTGNSSVNGDMWRLGTSTSNPNLNIDALQSNGDIVLRTGGTNERMRIDGSSGNAGIGTSSPGTYKLNVQNATDSAGAAYFISNGSNAWGVEIGTHNASSETDLVFNANSVIGSQDSLTFAAETGGYWRWMAGATSHKTGAAGASEVMRIDGSSGNVGINTSAPDTLFTVNGQVAIGDLVAGSANLTNFLSGTPPQLIAGWSIPAVTWTPGSWVEAVFTRDGDMGIDILASNSHSSIINFSDTDDEDVGKIEYDHATDYMRFNVNASERLRIDSAGHVAVGTTTTGNTSFTIATSSSGVTPNTTGDDLFIESSGNTGMTIASGTTSLGRIFFGDSGSAIAGRISYDHNDNSMFFGTNGNAERVTITSSGRLVIASAAPASDAYVKVPVGGTSLGAWASYSGSTSARTHMYFENPNGLVGSISTSGSATSFNTSSDYRLKTDVQPMTGASGRLQALRPVNFEWVADGSRTDGFLAHEAAIVVPEAIIGEKDAVDEEGNPEYQGIDQSKLVPLLTAALQEALTKIDDLEARVAALETA